MLTHNLGYPRIGPKRELKKACESYWKGKIDQSALEATAQEIRKNNWQTQQEAGIDLVPANDFAYYDHVLDMALVTGAIPDRFLSVADKSNLSELDLYFAMARGYQDDQHDVIAMEMTKWFDTNYHYIVPEFNKSQEFKLYSNKIIDEYKEAKEQVNAKPVILGPVSYLLLGKEKDEGFHRLDLLDKLLPVYHEILEKLASLGAEWVQLDEPYLAMDLDDQAKQAFEQAYQALGDQHTNLKLLLATYFEGIRDNSDLATALPIQALHLDLTMAPGQLDLILDKIPEGMTLSLGVVNGRNIWKNDFEHALGTIQKAREKLGEDRLMLAPSCSLLLSPYDLDLETNEEVLTPEIKNWLAFAKQKVHEVATLGKLASRATFDQYKNALEANKKALQSRRESELIHNDKVKQRANAVKSEDADRNQPFAKRKEKQRANLNLPEFPTTTIGSFPQTTDIRKLRRKFKKGDIDKATYEEELKAATKTAIKWQEEVNLDVLVHGEFERNDMVEYFGEQLEGYVFTENGWVQSFGSRCVKPPIIYGDVTRKSAMTVDWINYAQSLTDQPVKGMLTGPVTMLQWSFVRDDQPKSETCKQISLAIRDEVKDLEDNGTKVIQIDEPALREGLPLRRDDWDDYLIWAVNSFRLASAVVDDATQIHTHMCYAEFNDIIESIANLDADVITIETSRSQMELLDALVEFKYPNDIGPGVYDIHSPRIPTVKEMQNLINKAANVLPAENIWVNPDCGLKTRNWEEVKPALENMVAAAQGLREEVTV